MSGPSNDASTVPLPEGSLLVHIGPHKTGTTAVQSALWAARSDMRDQGVLFAAPMRNPARAVQAVVGRRNAFEAGPPPSIRKWNQLVRQARPRGRSRLVLSSEFLAHADAGTARRIVGDLGSDRTHVVVTLRPLAQIIPSMWQQNVRSGLKAPLETWARHLFEASTRSEQTPFWTLHRHDDLVLRWAEAVGPGNVTAVILDEGDREFVLRAFESLLALRDGTLAPQASRNNRSLTLEETEAVRAFNVAFDADGLDPALRGRVMRLGAAAHLVRLDPSPTDTRLRLPDAVIEQVRQTSVEIAQGIRDAGVRVVGDLDRLQWVPDAAGGPREDGMTTPEVAARLAMGVVLAAGRARRSPAETTPEQAAADAAELRDVATRQLALAVANRTRSTAQVRSTRSAYLARKSLAMARERIREAVSPGGAGAGSSSPPVPGVAAPPSPEPEHPIVHAFDGRPVEPFPPGTILLHIGPPKTGTTAIQAAFHAARPSLKAQGVQYAGRARHSIAAVHALLERPSFRTVGPPPMKEWQRLADEIRRSRADRIVLSSEFFADARADQIEKVLDALGGDRVQVVITLRPIAKIIPSQWQQYVQSGLRMPFDPWLRSILADPPGPASPSFWHRHRDDQLIARWAEVAGRDRVTAIALDERDHEFVLRAIEALTGLRGGTLALQTDLANRSLALPEVEAVRLLNEAFADAGLSRRQHSALVNFGATEYLKTLAPDPGAAKVALPAWTLERTGTLAQEIVDGLKRTGVRLIGEVDALAAVPPAGSAGPLPDVSRVAPPVAARLALGVLYATSLATPGDGHAGGRRHILPPIAAEPIELTRIPTKTLVRALARRALPGRTG